MYLHSLTQKLVESWKKWILSGRRIRLQRSPDEPGVKLRPTRRYKSSFSFACIWLFALGGLMFYLDWNDAEPGFGNFFLLVFGSTLLVLSSLGVMKAATEQISLDDIGLTRRWLLRSAHIPWLALSQVEPGSNEDFVVLVGRTGERIPVFFYLDGVGNLAERLDSLKLLTPLVQDRLGLR